MTDERVALDPELSELFRVEVARRAASLANAASDPHAALRTLHSLRGAAAMMGATVLAARLSALELALRDDPASTAPLLVESLGTALQAAGIDTLGLFSSPVAGLQGSRSAIVPQASDEEARPSSPTPGERASIERAPNRASVEPSGPISSLPPADRTSAERISFDALGPRPRMSVDPDVRAFFVSETYSRLELFSSAIVRAQNAEAIGTRTEALREAFRHAHSIKGSASTVGFHSIAISAHAIESALARLLAGSDAEPLSMSPLADAATQIAAALAVPEQADSCATDVQKLLKDAGYSLDTAALRAPTKSNAEPARVADAVRVPSTALHALGEKLTDIAAVGERVSNASARSIEFGRTLSSLSVSLDDAIRRLGPPRPWGVAAEVLERFHSVSRFLRDAAVALEGEGVSVGREADALSSITTEARDGLQQLGVTTVRWLFDRVVTVANATARSAQKELRVLREGEDVELPRAVAERLVEPIAQLARNAVVHGIESPTRRLAKHKSVRGLVRLAATRDGDVLTVVLEDDGAGVDLEAVKRRGQALGLLSSTPSDDDALAMLFIPGFSTRSRADTAAGRGVGLDLVRREALDLGGNVRVSSTAGRGTTFTLTVPIRAGTRGVVVVVCGHVRVAIPIERVRRVRLFEEGDRCISLGAWLGVDDSQSNCSDVVEISDGDDTIPLGVHSVEHAKEVVIRPLPALCVGVGPWIGAVIEPEGGVLLVLDPLRAGRYRHYLRGQ
jgi:two-component system chemotaxis sensor kinase CheA